MELYDPFDKLSFSPTECFLCGKKTDGLTEQSPVFPAWLMKKYNLYEMPFKLLDESMTTYEAMKTPACSKCDRDYLQELELKISKGFDIGFDGVSALDELTIFHWFSKILYGIIFIELQAAFTQHEGDEPLGISPSLLSKFRNLHLLLQSLRMPLVYEDFQPWSLVRVKLSTESNVFDYRDEMATMIFSLAIKDAGILICLQDHGKNLEYHGALLKKINGKTLELMQFQELCALFYYSAYLFNPIAQYLILPPAGNNNEYSLSPQPLEGVGLRALFNPWDTKVYAQVLEAFWKPWNITKDEIRTNPEKAMTKFIE